MLAKLTLFISHYGDQSNISFSKLVTVADALEVSLPRLGLILTLISAGSK